MSSNQKPNGKLPNCKKETPMRRCTITPENQIRSITGQFTKIMATLGLDLEDDSLKDTPKRVAKMYVNEWFSGLHPVLNFPRITTVENKMGYNQMLIERDIKVHSVCEHHFVPIVGVAHVAYLPKKKVIGLSKINRIVDYYSRRPQIQERLTEQIWLKLTELLGTKDVAVVIKAQHFCVIMRGIKDVNSSTITSKLGGSFENTEARSEFFNLIK